MNRLPLSHRISAVFAALLLACCGASAWLQMHSSERHEQEAVQRLSASLAAHIASHSTLMMSDGVNAQAVHDLFEKLMDVNPSVEVYLLAQDGRIQAQAAPEGHLKRDRVDLEPVTRLLAGGPLPVFGDDPRSDTARKVFSVAPLRVDGRPAGYVYVILLGENHDALSQHVATDSVVRTTLWSMALVAALGLLAGLAAFHWITRPLRRLTDEVHCFQADGAVRPSPLAQPTEAIRENRDEIATLRLAFAQMTRRIADQWRELTAQDQQRRELVANISHDLRTPLTSLHGYLETLRLKADVLSPAEQQRYLDIAIGQSRNVGRLAQELFELARLEYGGVKPDMEHFSLPELLQDVFQKFELSTEAKQLRMEQEIDPDLPVISADLGMIERVLTNLLDNAIRHTPVGGRVEVLLRRTDGGVEAEVRDSGPGFSEPMRVNLFTRPALRTGTGDSGGGLGLLIVQRILQLHGSDIRLVQRPDTGAAFLFQLSAAR